VLNARFHDRKLIVAEARRARRDHDRDRHGGPRLRHQAGGSPRNADHARTGRITDEADKAGSNRAHQADVERSVTSCEAEDFVEIGAAKGDEAAKTRNRPGASTYRSEATNRGRIDNQLARSGRQGDSRALEFFLSLETI